MLVNRKIIVIGDSYTGQQYPNITKYWYQYFRDYLGLISGTNLFVKGTPGAGFANDGFYNDLVERAGMLTESIRNEITDIFVVGGWNDRTSTRSVLSAKMTAFNDYAKTNFPNAKVTIGFVGNSAPSIRQSDENRNGAYKALINYNDISATLGWYTIKNSQYILHNYNSTYWQEDGVHPSQLGQTELGIKLTEGFLTHVCDIHHADLDSYSVAVASGRATGINIPNFITGIDNELSYITQTNNNNYFTMNGENMSFTGVEDYELATISGTYFNGNAGTCSTVVPILIDWLEDGSAIRANGYATLYIQYGKLHIKPVVFYNNTAVQNKAIRYVYIPAFNIKVSSHYA